MTIRMYTQAEVDAYLATADPYDMDRQFIADMYTHNPEWIHAHVLDRLASARLALRATPYDVHARFNVAAAEAALTEYRRLAGDDARSYR